MKTLVVVCANARGLISGLIVAVFLVVNCFSNRDSDLVKYGQRMDVRKALELASLTPEERTMLDMGLPVNFGMKHVGTVVFAEYCFELNFF